MRREVEEGVVVERTDGGRLGVGRKTTPALFRISVLPARLFEMQTAFFGGGNDAHTLGRVFFCATVGCWLQLLSNTTGKGR